MLELIQLLPGYGHTVLVTGAPESTDQTLMWALHAIGVDLLFQSRHCDYANYMQYSAIILYGISASAVCIPSTIPRIYYAYNAYDPAVDCDVLIMPSQFAADMYNPLREYEIIPPGIRSRLLRRAADKSEQAPFTFGLFSSGASARYPLDLVAYLMSRVPKGMRMLITATDNLPKPPTDKSVWVVPRMIDATVKGIQLSDVVIYAAADSYMTTFGRTCAEAMAARLPVICQRHGAPVTLLKENENVLMFDNPDEVLDKLKYLHDNPGFSERLAANGQVWASWQDIATQVGLIRGILKSLGA